MYTEEVTYRLDFLNFAFEVQFEYHCSQSLLVPRDGTHLQIKTHHQQSCRNTYVEQYTTLTSQEKRSAILSTDGLSWKRANPRHFGGKKKFQIIISNTLFHLPLSCPVQKPPFVASAAQRELNHHKPRWLP